MYINRKIESKILESKPNIPVIAIIGPRQSGKTTLSKKVFNDYIYVNLEYPDIRLLAQTDPRSFLSQSTKMIIDEIQRVPELFSYIQGFVDEFPDKKYVLTGSNNFTLMEKIGQSLAGRVAIFNVLPFSQKELIGFGNYNDLDKFKIMQKGMYPRVWTQEINSNDWYKNYVQTYLEKDVRDTYSINLMDSFYIFLKVLATRSGSILNLSTISNEVNVSANTIKAWINILEQSFIIFKLQPYLKNLKKRTTKLPKIYFYDTGLLCSLLNIQNSEELEASTFKGFIFENFIISEYKKEVINDAGELCFWREDTKEVDLIEVKNNILNIFEIKLKSVIKSEDFKNLENFKNIFETNINNIKQSLIFGGETNYIDKSVDVLSWKSL